LSDLREVKERHLALLQERSSRRQRRQGETARTLSPPPEKLRCRDFLSSLTTIEAYLDLQAFLDALPEEECRFERRYLARTDLYYLLRYELHRADVARQWLLDRCREVQAEPDGYLDLWPREHYKSTIKTFGLTIRDILASHGEQPIPDWKGSEPTFGIFSHTRPIAKGFLRQIKTEFEINEDLKDLFPDILWSRPKREALKWSEDDGLSVKRRSNPNEQTVEAWGLIDGQPTSKHFGVLVYDDIVTRESVTGPEMIQKTTDGWSTSTNLGSEGGRKRYHGTRWDEADTYQTMQDRGSVKVRIVAGSDTGEADGKPLLISQESWNQKRLDMGPFVFSCQMLNRPETNRENAFFRVVDGLSPRYYEWKSPPRHLRKYAVTDGAVTDEEDARLGQTSYTVHIVFGVDPRDNVYILDLWRGQTDADIWVDAQIDLVELHNRQIVKWFGEGGIIEKAVGPSRRKRMQERRAYFTYETLPTIGEGDKEMRAVSFQGRWNLGKVYLPQGAPWVEGFLWRLKRFPRRPNDEGDAAGMIGRALDLIYRAGIPPARPTGRLDDPATILTGAKIDTRLIAQPEARAEQPATLAVERDDPATILARIRAIREGKEVT